MREQLKLDLNAAMKARDALKVATLRLVNDAVKNKDIEARGLGKGPLSDEDILNVLQKLIKQRQESAEIYEKAGRQELASQERGEIAIIAAYLPQQVTDEEMRAIIARMISETQAASLKDMGKVMSALRAGYAGKMDFAKASTALKDMLKG